MHFYQKLNQKKRLAVNILSIGGNIKQASESAGVSRNTITVWMNEPEFISAIDEKTNELCDQVYRKIIAASSLATKTLIDVLNDVNSSTRDKIQASSKLLDLAMKRQDYLLAKKIEMLEGMYGNLDSDLAIDVPSFEDDDNAELNSEDS